MISRQEKKLPFKDKDNPLTARKHRREFWWQILIPIIFLFILLVYGVYFLLSNNTASVASMAQIGSMMLLLPVILFAVVFFVLCLALIYLLAIVIKWIPPKANLLQNIIYRVNHRVKQAADISVKPLIFIESWTKAARNSINRYL